MFGWGGFTNMAEAMFTQWIIKRVCKFLLKKKMGDVIGEIELDQVDVELRKGSIQLNDLCLNVDFINCKLGDSPVFVKEGSIASLSIKIPWKMKNCQIEVEGLDLVLAPCEGNKLRADADSFMPIDDDKEYESYATEKLEQGMTHSSSGTVSLDVHEGVKTIAKIVKRFLTSFNVRLKNVFLEFDPYLDMDDRRSQIYRSLCLRIAEMEYGTCVSEDSTTIPTSKCDGLLGMTTLTNFIKFQGAVVEFLQTDEVDNGPQNPFAVGITINEFNAGSMPLHSTSPVLTGPSGGFSGTLNLSIPWKNGSLDIRKVDVYVSIDPVELRLQLNTIEWIIFSWESLKERVRDQRNHIHFKASDSVYDDHNSHIHSTRSSVEPCTDMVTPSSGKFSLGVYNPINQGTLPNAFVPNTNLIHNWVSLPNNAVDHTELGESIDQFFECLDEMRSSQSSLGNSGIWNWTSSVFSAITAASSLASGSGHIPSEQQHTETNLKATVAAFSVVLNGLISKSCMSTLSSTNVEHSAEVDSIDQTLHCLEVKCQDLALSLQICPQSMKFEATIGHIKVEGYMDTGNQALRSGIWNCENDFSSQMPLVHHLQAGVQVALEPFPFSATGSEADTIDCLLNMQPTNDNVQKTYCRNVSHHSLVKIELLESFSLCRCKYSRSSANSNDRSMTSATFTVELPLFILWVDFSLVNLLLVFFEQVGNSFEKDNINVFGEKHDPSHDDMAGGTCTCSKTSSLGGSLQGNIVLPHARIIFCFPSENLGDYKKMFCWDNFLSFEFSSQSLTTDKTPISIPASNFSSQKGNSCTPTLLHLHNGNLDISLVTSSEKDVSGNKSCMRDRANFVSKKILSITRGANDRHFGITMLWQKGPVTGPWMVERARRLATSQFPRSRMEATEKGHEFLSATTAEDLEETNSGVRQEMILSSAFFMHICLSHVWVDLCTHDYKPMCHLVNQVKDWLSCLAHAEDATVESLKMEKSSGHDCNASQASVLVECDLLNVRITLDEFVEISPSLQKELPGSWNCIKLAVEKFELFSVSNIGGTSNENLLWLSHGEGELWGSIVDLNEEASITNLLLITCKNSIMRRGDGEGGNMLSSGSVGTSIIHRWNPLLFESSTSVIVRCGTIIAPGGRLDWFNTICLFFSFPFGDEVTDDSIQDGCSEGNAANTFILDLVDIALSYEPHPKTSMMNAVHPHAECCISPIKNEDSGEQYVACLLAASSLNLSNQIVENTKSNDYNIILRGLGLLICESSGFKADGCKYDAKCLQRAGYVKVAREALVDAILRINCQNGLLWEVEFSDLHVSMDTCYDTTSGLVQLVAQLQQLFAPDVEDAFVHLQSRWASLKQDNDGENLINTTTSYDINSGQLASCERLSTNDKNSTYVGLMDEILDDAFYWQGKQIPRNDSCNMQSDVSLYRGLPKIGYNLNISSRSAGDLSLPNACFNKSVPRLGRENIQISPDQNMCLPQFIESYYMSELLPQTEPYLGSHSSNEAQRHDADIAIRRDAECGKGGWYRDSPLMIVDDHISDGIDQDGWSQLDQENKPPSVKSTSAETCKARGRVLLKNVDVRWGMYAGSDWPKERKGLVNSLNSDGRDENVCLELTVSGLNLQYDMYPDRELFVSKLSLSVQDFYLYDSSRNAPWKMVLGYYHSKNHPRESFAKAFKLDLEAVRPDPLIPLEEYRLHITFMPMRLHLDQGQLIFLTSFFGTNSSNGDSPSRTNDLGGTGMERTKKRSIGGQSIAEEALLPFFQKCDIRPAVVCIDYIPHHIDLAALKGGKYVELINLVPWKGIDLQLKHVHAVGIYGWGSVCEAVVGEWLEDISQNQVHKVLKGLTPIRSLFAVSSGAAKLVSLPVKNYRKDHRLLKGIQRGAVAFLRSVSLEAVGLGVHLAAGAHDIILQTECVLARIPPSIPLSGSNRWKTNVGCNQPNDTQHGFRQACEVLTDGFGKTASLVGTPLRTYQRGGGAGSALASAVRAAPAAAIAPASAVTRALHCTLLGVRNSLDPEHKKESMEKYLGSTRSRDQRTSRTPEPDELH